MKNKELPAAIIISGLLIMKFELIIKNLDYRLKYRIYYKLCPYTKK